MPKKDPKTQRHINQYKFKHNKNSKKTIKILSSPVSGLCEKCREIIEWRKTYRKYKPLTTPRKCNICQNKTVTSAYHNVCKKCSTEKKICSKCNNPHGAQAKKEAEDEEVEIMAKEFSTVSLRKQRSILRKLEKEESGNKNKKKKRNKDGDEIDDDDDDDDGDDDEDEDENDEDIEENGEDDDEEDNEENDKEDIEKEDKDQEKQEKDNGDEKEEDENEEEEDDDDENDEEEDDDQDKEE